MNRTKTIYFLSAIVLIVGCFALNLSYSLFVQTEEKEAVSSYVPSLLYSLNDSNETSATYEIPANTTKLIVLKVNNLGNSNIKYQITGTIIDGLKVDLINSEDNKLNGILESTKSKYVYLNVTNETEENKNIIFNMNANYETLNFDLIDSNINISDNELDKLNDLILTNALSSYNTENQDASQYNNGDISLNSIEDNYGTSYYYKGNVIDNYINFNDMCFRIVRILGNGNIKLILEDANNTCENLNDTITNTYETDKLFFDDFNNDNSYNFKNITDDNKLYLANESWNNLTTKDIKYNDLDEILTESDLEICTKDNTCEYNYNLNKIEDLKFENPINSIFGSLSYKEVKIIGDNSYLNNNKFNLIELSNYKNNTDYRYIYENNKLTTELVSTKYNYRPSIVLNSNITVTGNGTISNPYIIK
mgnify:CR=1 FL=1